MAARKIPNDPKHPPTTRRQKLRKQPVFSLRIVAPGLHPDAVPPRLMYDALAAIQDLAAGRDPFETPKVPADKTIGLIDVKRGSAIYQFTSRAPDDALRNLTWVGALIVGGVVGLQADENADRLVAALRPLETLSEIAKSIEGHIEVRGGSDQLLKIGESDYRNMSRDMFLDGETTVSGEVQRVGGATDTKCLVRIAGRRQILYCEIRNRELARRLGQHLYQTVVLHGTATWIHRNWRIVRFKIMDFSQPVLTDVDAALKSLRLAGLDSWDAIDDPDSLIRGATG